jgi:hypothetical protein
MCLNEEHYKLNDNNRTSRHSCVYCKYGIDYIKQQKKRENDTYDMIKHHGFTREVQFNNRRADFVKYLPNNNILIVECNEDGHKSYKHTELERELEIMKDNDSNFIFIHFNPDLYRTEGVKYRIEMKKRGDILNWHIRDIIKYGKSKSFPKHHSISLYYNEFNHMDM